MSEVWRTAWTVARSGWRANYNRAWKFSRGKSAAIFTVAYVLVIYIVMQRAGQVSAGRADLGLQGLVVLLTVQLAWSGLLRGYTRGQFQLYQGILVPLFQISPARPIAFLIGRSLEGTTVALRNAAIWAFAYSAAIPGPRRWAAALLLFAAGLLVGAVAQLAGLLTLALVSRLSPRSLNSSLFAAFAVSLGAASWAAIFLARGGTIADLALLARQYRAPIIAVSALLLGGPGLGLLVAFLFVPEPVENLYRVGLYRVLELRDQADARPRRSLWLPLAPGPFRGILARQWLTDLRSAVTRFRLMIWLAAGAGVWFSGAAARGQGAESAVAFVGSLAVLAWGLSSSPQVASAFTSERVTSLLYRLAGVRPLPLFAAKFAGLWLPSLLGVALPTLVGGLRAGLSTVDLLTLLGWSCGAMTAGTLGGLGLAAATAGEEPDEPESQGVGGVFGPGQDSQSGTVWAIARTLGLLLPTVLCLWAGAGQLGSPLPVPTWSLVVLLVLLTALCLTAGLALMAWGWRTPHPRLRPPLPAPAAAARRR